MPISISDTFVPAGDFPISLGKDIQGALTGSSVSSSGEILGATGSFTGTGSFGHVSSSGRIQAVLVDNAGGSLKQVIYDDTSGELFTTTSTAAGTPSLEAVSQVSPFKIAAGTVLTASDGVGTGLGTNGIFVNKIFNGSGAGRIEFVTQSFGPGSDEFESVFSIRSTNSPDNIVGSSPQGIFISGGRPSQGQAPRIHADHASPQPGLVIAHNDKDIITASNQLTGLSGPSYNLVINKGNIGTVSGFGNIRFNLGRTEGLDIRQLIVRSIGSTTDSTTQYDTTIKTRIGQTGGTGGDQFLDFSGSGVIIQPTSSLPTPIAGGIVYSGSQFYIAVP